MKKTVLLAMGLLTMTTTAGLAQTAGFETAAQAVKNMGLGWNLGNTLDANSQQVTDVNNAAYWGQQDLTSENCWGQYTTRPELMAMMKNAGFGAIRVPVTWYNHMDKDGNVDAAWMQRVHQVVDYVVSQGLYCLLNVHHDTGADSYDDKGNLNGYHWLKADEHNYAQNRSRYEHLWKQIATEFRDYDQHLLFEGYNEMLDDYDSWCFASFATPSGYNSTVAAQAYQAINDYAQTFVDAVRSTGGNNAERNLVVCTYGACDGGGTWNTHLQDPLKQMKLPNDTNKGHLAFEVHSYPNVQNLTNVKSQVRQTVTALNTYLAAKGAPVIFGEWGTASDDDYNNQRSNMLAFARYFVEQTKAAGMATFYWMGLSDGADRDVPCFTRPDLVDALVKGFYGDAGFTNGTASLQADANEADVVDVYTLSGVLRQARVKRSELRQRLPRGIYLIEGKKVVF